MTGQRIHRHESRSKEELIVFQRIHRSHNGILFPLVWEYGHFIFSIERFLYFCFRTPCLFHDTITVSLLHGPGHDRIHFCLCQLIRKRSRFLFPFFLEEAGLQILRHMFVNSFLSIFLHTWVDSGINLQTIRIDIIISTIFLLVFSTPTEKRICLPSQWILIIFLHLPSAVVTFLRFFSRHHSTQIFTEVSSQSFLMIYTTIFQDQWQCL